jgi:hypothetical protein
LHNLGLQRLIDQSKELERSRSFEWRFEDEEVREYESDEMGP